MELRLTHVRKAEGCTTQRSGNDGFVAMIRLVQAQVFVVSSTADVQPAFIDCVFYLYLDGRFVHFFQRTTNGLSPREWFTTCSSAALIFTDKPPDHFYHRSHRICQALRKDGRKF